MKHTLGATLGGSLLVAGTSIGAGMLALPVVTAAGGFLPSLFVYLSCWAFMTCTGLLLLELCLRLPPDANLVTMAETYLGRPGKYFAWILYLFLFYTLTVAYISGGGGLLQAGTSLSYGACQWIFTLIFGGVVVAGAKRVNRLNLGLMAGLILTYLSFVFFGLPHVQLAHLQEGNWALSFSALPIIFTAFSYQGIIPTLTNYLKRDARQIRIAILSGTSMAFFIYILWQLLILGIIPLEGLESAQKLGQTAVAPLSDHVSSPLIPRIGQIFAFFAIATSFLGVTLGLMDFLADGLKLPKKGSRRAFLAFLTFALPLAVSLTYPNIFLIALTFAGGIGCALLLGGLPTLMVWRARYSGEGHGGPIQLPGGRILLSLLFFFVLFELSIEFLYFQ